MFRQGLMTALIAAMVGACGSAPVATPTLFDPETRPAQAYPQNAWVVVQSGNQAALDVDLLVAGDAYTLGDVEPFGSQVFPVADTLLTKASEVQVKVRSLKTGASTQITDPFSLHKGERVLLEIQYPVSASSRIVRRIGQAPGTGNQQSE